MTHTYRHAPSRQWHADGMKGALVAAMRGGVGLWAVLLLLPSSARAAPPGPVLGESAWGLFLLGLAAGAAAMGLVHWLRLRRVREQAEARAEALEAEKQTTEQALQEATDRTDALESRVDTLEARAQRLEALNDATSEFLKDVSHAFRRLLTLTLGPVDTLLEGPYGSLSEEARTQLRLVQRSGTRVLWLAGQLMDLAELETDNMTLAPTEGDLSAFVARSVRSFEDLAERRGVNLGFESALEDPMLAFDEAKMETMLANLLSSAFRAATEDGSVQVVLRPAESGAEETGDAVELLVEHTGSAPDAELTSHLLEAARAEETFREPGPVSASVGLHLVDQLADLHGGELLQARTSEEEKTRIVVRLPRRPPAFNVLEQSEPEALSGGDAIPRFLDGTEDRGTLELSRRALASQPSADAEAAASDPTIPPSSGENGPLPSENGLPGSASRPDEEIEANDGTGSNDKTASDEDRTTVLVIDDNSVICTLVRAHLEPEYRVVEAHNGAEGYQLARSILPDLVITDVMMPEVDGFELCRKIKEDPDVDHVPVVFLTARADLEGKVEGLGTGADAYLTKPFEPEELIARVKNLIETRQSLRESFRAEASPMGEAPPAASGTENAASALPPTAEAGSLKETIEEAIGQHLTDPEFGVSELAERVALSASQLRRRMKNLYDRTPVQLIRRRRLEAGARLLREREDATIGEVAYAVGFNSQSYFSRAFRDEFGTSPSRYRKEGVAA